MAPLPSVGRRTYLELCFAEACFETCLRRSAQRFFIASAIRLRPSGVSLRFRLLAVLVLAVVPLVLPLGRPRPARTGWEAPARSARSCCSFSIWASISLIIRVTSTGYLLKGGVKITNSHLVTYKNADHDKT